MDKKYTATLENGEKIYFTEETVDGKKKTTFTTNSAMASGVVKSPEALLIGEPLNLEVYMDRTQIFSEALSAQQIEVSILYCPSVVTNISLDKER